MKKIAARIKDAEAYEKAPLIQLEHENEFAANYQQRFQPGRPNSDRADRISAEEHCKRHGFLDRTVRRWAERLGDRAKLEAKLRAREAFVD
jgi:hypothetical protein